MGIDTTMSKIAIITGADGDMGQVATLAIAQAGYKVIMASKDPQRAESVCRKLQQQSQGDIEVIPIDLASIESVKNFCEEIKSRFTHIDILLNNAGTLNAKASVTADGLEMIAGVNYLGHYLLTNLLFPLFGQGTRIIFVGSLSYKWYEITSNLFTPIDPQHYNRFVPYSRSKRALLFFALDIAEKWQSMGITVNYADPGIVSTNIIRMGNPFIDKLCDIFYRPFIKKPKQGAATAIFLSLSHDVREVTGSYFINKKSVVIPEKIIRSEERLLLHQLTTDWLSQHHINLP